MAVFAQKYLSFAQNKDEFVLTQKFDECFSRPIRMVVRPQGYHTSSTFGCSDKYPGLQMKHFFTLKMHFLTQKMAFFDPENGLFVTPGRASKVERFGGYFLREVRRWHLLAGGAGAACANYCPVSALLAS